MRTVDQCDLSRHILQSGQFSTFSMSDRYRELEKRTNVDFSAAIRFLDHLPVFMNGSSHEIVRKRMAKQVSSTMIQQLDSGQSEVDQRLEKLFFRGSRFDLVNDFILPVWRAISGAIVLRDKDVIDLVDRIPELFYPMLSIRERLKINGAIARFIETHCGPDDDEKLLLLCLSVLGARPFVGAISLSLYDVFANNPSIRMSDIAWPGSFPSSSLRYVDRIAQTDVAAATEHFSAGERIRCVTQSANYASDDNRKMLFGIGKHTCIGKLTSEKMWAHIVRRFAEYDFRVECTGLTMAEQNDPFTMPATATILLG
jgi:hypothetical protein